MREFNYQQAINFLDSFTNYEKVRSYKYNALYFNLDRMRHLLSLFSNPHQKFPSIHIAGTKGKGSTAVMISYILASAGYKVGLYTSPHLIDLCERIKILDRSKLGIKEEMIKKIDVIRLTSEIKNVVDNSFNPPLNSQFLMPTTFELYTLLAFIYFVRKKIDIAILETGMGGRLDATNVIKPLICVITSISYDHTKELGRSLKKIAREKAGIIKKESLVISANQRKEVKSEIFKKCQKEKAQLWEIDRDIKIVPFTTFTKLNSKYGQYFSVWGIKDDYNIFLPLLGEYQMENAALAIGAIELLTEYGFKIPKSDFVNGLKQLSWWGRFQIIDNKPKILLDGAHNQASAENLKKTIRKIFPNKRKILLILSIFKDKDADGICRVLLPLAQEVVLTQVNSPRVMTPEELLKVIKKIGKNLHLKINLAPSLTSAFNYASSWRKDGLVLITGSLYLVGEALNFFRLIHR